MSHFEFNWKSEDGLSIFGQGWQPENKARAVICLVHGLGEHSGRYAHVAQALNAAGYALLAFDLRGHGKSGGPRGHSPSLEAMLRDIDCLLREAEQRFPGSPRFLYGHSLGGTLALDYLISRRPALAGAVVSSPALHSALEEQKAKVALARILGRLLPTMTVASGLNPHDISHDPAVVQAYMNDPLVHNKMTTGLGAQSLEGIRYALAHASEISLPILLVHGTGDAIAFPSSSQEVAAAVHGDCTLKLWDGLAHETHNEPQQKEVLAYDIAWLDRHLPA